MRTSLARRLLAVVLTTAAAFAQPGEALAHGFAHQREHQHEQRQEHQHEQQHEQQHERHQATDNDERHRVDAPDHAHGHAHSAVDDASIRNKVGMQTLVHEVALPESRMLDVAVAAPSLRAPLARGDPATGPPPRLRAPPVR